MLFPRVVQSVLLPEITERILRGFREFDDSLPLYSIYMSAERAYGTAITISDGELLQNPEPRLSARLN